MPKAKSNTKKVAVKLAKRLSPLYTVSGLTKNSDKKLWVAFRANNLSSGYVFSSTLTRDQVRNQTRRIMGLRTVSDVRSCRVSTYRRRQNAK